MAAAAAAASERASERASDEEADLNAACVCLVLRTAPNDNRWEIFDLVLVGDLMLHARINFSNVSARVFGAAVHRKCFS